MVTLVFGLGIVAWLAVIVVGVRKYWDTRNAGFLWLVGGLVVWPLVVQFAGPRIVAAVEEAALRRGAAPGGLTVGELIAIWGYLHRIIGHALALVGLVLLYPRRQSATPAT